MENPTQIRDLERLLDRIATADEDDDGRVTLRAVLQVIGRRSFGPFLLLAGLITVTPIVGDVPGVPIMMGLLVLLVAGQLLLRRDHFWLPHWLLSRSVPRDKLCKALDWVRPAARFLDRLLRPRLQPFTRGLSVYVIAATCIGIAGLTPAMELVPFSANLAGIALIAYGLALIACDGLLALLAFGFTTGMFVLVGYGLSK